MKGKMRMVKTQMRKGVFSSLNVHLIGIGGVGMSALSRLLLQSGAKVSGSDLVKNELIEELVTQGVIFHKGHFKENIKGKDVVIYSSAIDSKNVEFQAALRAHIPLMPRGQALAEMMRFKRNLVITGSHGKTTTTALCISLFTKAGENPSYMLGGKFKAYPFRKSHLFSKNQFLFSSKLSPGNWFIAEADESDETLKYFLPEVLIITNVDKEHLEYHKTLFDLKRMLLNLALRLPLKGTLIFCGDCLNLFSLLKSNQKDGLYEDFNFSVGTQKKEILEKINLSHKALSYGFHERNDYVLQRVGEVLKESDVRDFDFKEGNHRYSYSVFYRKRKIFSFSPNLPGDQNALNALASILAGFHSGIDIKTCIESVESFVGVKRRMDYIGRSRKVEFFDDYGHHPTEISALLKTFRETFPEKRLVVLFQPHRFSRTKICWEDFLNCFHEAHKVFVLDIFSAGEKPIPGIHSKIFCEKHKKANYLPENEIPKLKNEIKKGDIFLTLGAGDVRKWGERICGHSKSFH